MHIKTQSHKQIYIPIYKHTINKREPKANINSQQAFCICYGGQGNTVTMGLMPTFGGQQSMKLSWMAFDAVALLTGCDLQTKFYILCQFKASNWIWPLMKDSINLALESLAEVFKYISRYKFQLLPPQQLVLRLKKVNLKRI